MIEYRREEPVARTWVRASDGKVLKQEAFQKGETLTIIRNRVRVRRREQSMIDIRNVTKSYGPKVAVQDLTLHVPAGELFAFLGPNGAGKTTTIKMLCGLLFPTSGAVRVGGFDLRTRGRPGPGARQLRARTSRSCTRS